MTARYGRWSVSLLAAALLATAGVSAQRGAPADGEWPTYSGDLGGTKYSPLDRIDADNFGRLEVAWRWRSADAVLSLDMPGGGERRADSPLIFADLGTDTWDGAQDGAPWRNAGKVGVWSIISADPELRYLYLL